MKTNYKEELNKLVDKKKKEIPTIFSEVAVANIFGIQGRANGHASIFGFSR
jgi:hypothetical protein